MFVLFFGEIFALFFRIIFFAKFSHYFFSHFFAKQIEAKFCEKKAKIFAFFASERNAKTKRNGRKKKNREKCEIFAKRFFPFAGMSGNPTFNPNPLSREDFIQLGADP